MMPKPFQGLRTFCKVSDDTEMRYAVIGLPTDTATTYRPGSRFAPAAIREASMMLTDGYHPEFPVDIAKHTVDLGDADLTVGNTLKMLKQVESVANNVLKWNKHPVFLGGDHTVTLGILRAINKMYGKVAVIHLDAHCDTWGSNFDEPIGHGTWLFNAIKEKIVDPTKVVSIGIRSPVDPETKQFLANHGGHTITAAAAMRKPYDVYNRVLEIVGNTPVYLTFDIDSLDPAHAPGTGTPEIGGLSTRWVLDFFEMLYGLNWVGMDLVEVAPPYDHAEITSLAAATICWTYLSMVIHSATVTPSVDLEEYECGDSDEFGPPPMEGPVGPS